MNLPTRPGLPGRFCFPFLSEGEGEVRLRIRPFAIQGEARLPSLPRQTTFRFRALSPSVRNRSLILAHRQAPCVSRNGEPCAGNRNVTVPDRGARGSLRAPLLLTETDPVGNRLNARKASVSFTPLRLFPVAASLLPGVGLLLPSPIRTGG